MNVAQSAVILGGIGTLAVFSFLWRENRFYRFFEHLFVGVSAGYGFLYAVKNFLAPKIVVPLLGLDIYDLPTGEPSSSYHISRLLLLFPILVGLLFYASFSRRYAWLSKLVVAFTLGLTAGASFEGIVNGMTPQIVESFKPVVVFDAVGGVNWLATLDAVVFAATLLSVLYYFFFTVTGVGAGSMMIRGYARIILMVCFGAFFGSTVMARMALLVERLDFLLNQWWGAVLQLVLGQS